MYFEYELIANQLNYWIIEVVQWKNKINKESFSDLGCPSILLGNEHNVALSLCQSSYLTVVKIVYRLLIKQSKTSSPLLKCT